MCKLKLLVLLVLYNPVLSASEMCRQHLERFICNVFLVMRLVRHPTGLKTRAYNERNKLFVENAIKQNGVDRAPSLLVKQISWWNGNTGRSDCEYILTPTTNGSTLVIVFMTKAIRLLRGNQLLLYLNRNGFRLIDLLKTRYAWMNISETFNTDTWRDLVTALLRCHSATTTTQMTDDVHVKNGEF